MGQQVQKKLNQKGNLTITQSKDSCVVYGMPKEADKLNASSFQCNPEELKATLKKVNS